MRKININDTDYKKEKREILSKALFLKTIVHFHYILGRRHDFQKM